MLFEADLKDGKFSRVVISLNNNRVEVDGNSYELSGIDDVILEEGLGINRIYLVYKGRKELLAEFTNRKKEEMMNLYYAIKGRTVNFKESERKEPKREGTLRFALSLISPYKYRVALGTAISFALVALSLIPPYLLKLLINGVFEGKGVEPLPSVYSTANSHKRAQRWPLSTAELPAQRKRAEDSECP